MKEGIIMPKKSNLKEFKQKVYDKVKNEYSVIGEYKNHMTKIEMKHNICGFEYSVTPNKFLDLDRRCPKCFGNIKKTLDEVKDEISNLTNGEYTLVGEYKDTNTPIKIQHNKCGEIFEMRRTDFVKPNGNRCPYCAGLKKKDIEIVKREINYITNGEFLVESKEYKNNKTKIEIKHLKCGRTFKNSYNIFTKHTSCPYCLETDGESKIRYFLNDKHINFKSQYRLRKFSSYHSFDFAVFDEINNLTLLIEYDGRAHYEPIYGEAAFKSQKKNDTKKDTFCLENNIKLLRIPYWDFNKINDILSSTTIENTSKDGSE
jgi:hypothetical protein